jgi:RHS repeat-associated protein
MTTQKHISTEFQGGLPRMLRRSWKCADMDPDNVELDEDFIINQTNNPENELYFYHTDHLGSSSWITDASGAVNQYLAYLPFGESYIDQRTNGHDIRFKFTGKERDQETGYDYFGARYYSSELSVWLSVDPMSDKHPNFNPYAYVYQNPINLVDPWGLDSIQLHRDGSTNVYATTKDDFDIVVASDNNGDLDRSKTHQIDKGVYDSKRTNKIEVPTGKVDKNGDPVYADAYLDEYDVNDYSKAKTFFEFMADNSDVEFGHNIVGNSNRSIITTTHEKLFDAGGGYLLANGYTLKDRRHSHPNHKQASGRDRDNIRDFYKRKFPNMLYYIYYKGGYYKYNESRTNTAHNQQPNNY